MSKIEIRYIRGEHQFGRAIMFGQLYDVDKEKNIMDGSLAQIIAYATTNKMVIANAQAVLKTVVLDNGFAS
jgi:hypothetical protein